MEVAASIVAVVYQACQLAVNIQQLIQNVKQHDERMKDLEDKLEEFKGILKHASDAYGQNGSKAYPPEEQDIRKMMEKIVNGCNEVLKQFEEKIRSFVAHGNWASMAWKQKTMAPAVADIEEKLSDRHQRLSMLVQLLQGRELREILRILRKLSNTTPNDDRLAATIEDQNADAGFLKQKAISLIGKEESTLGQESSSRVDENKRPQTQEHPKSKDNGALLLKAIEEGDKDTFESLLWNEETSLAEKDAKQRNPLLLAAHLDKNSMVKDILDSDAEKGNQQEIDFTATDSAGRTALHYCAEFGMDGEIRILLDHDVNIDARDHDDRPPAYYAVKYRRYKVVKLLLERGASTDFDRAIPEGISQEIQELLEKASENGTSASGSNSG